MRAVRRPPCVVSLLALGAACGGTSGSASDPAGARPPAGRATAAGESVAPVARCGPPTASESTAAAAVLSDLAFEAVGGDTLRLDLALPARVGPHPVVVLLHGGGWEGGDRRDMHREMRVLAARGYAAAAVSYRLTRASRDVFPAAVQDVRCAVRWLRARAPELDLDAAHVGALGFSAGAHLASMLGTGVDERVLDPVAQRARAAVPTCLTPADPSATVQAVVSVAGPQDLRVDGPYTREQARLVTNFLGVFPGDAPQVARAASPIAHVSPGAAPFLLIHGTRDELVPIAHARRMRDALRAVGVPATMLELRGVGHAFPGLDSDDAPSVGCTTLAFLDRWLRSP
jgi:acetyl esterase/lipase